MSKIKQIQALVRNGLYYLMFGLHGLTALVPWFWSSVVLMVGAFVLFLYLIPTTLDVPPVDVTILESPYPHGPFGAKGVGEMPMSGPAPAVANAARHLGLDVRSLPITPEKVLECASRSTEDTATSTRRR